MQSVKIPQVKFEVTDLERNAINRVTSSGNFVKGIEGKNLEKNFAKYLNCKYAIAVSSGTVALEIIYKYLNQLNFRQNIIPANTFLATANASILNNINPIIHDIDPITMNIDINEAISNLPPNQKNIITPVHLYGNPVDNIDKLSNQSDNDELYIVEDACQAHGSEFKNRKIGTYGFASAFSLFPTKNLGTVGDGGLIATNDETFHNFAQMMKNAGRTNEPNNMNIPGSNYRLSEIQAAVALDRLEKLDEWNAHRIKLANIYLDELSNLVPHIFTQKVSKYSKHVYHQFTISTEKRDKLKSFLQKNGVSTSIKYELSLSQTNFYKKFPNLFLNNARSNKLVSSILCLPISQWHTEDEIKIVSSLIKQFFS